MLKSFRSGAIVLSLLTVGGGVAAADPVNVPDVAQYVDTVDHWRLTASLTGVTINPVPNSAATAFSREGFISGLATETIEGSGSPPVDKGTLRLWVQFGCQIDLRNGVNLSSTMQSVAQLPFSIADILGTPVIAVSEPPAQSISPSITATVRPGTIFRAEVANKDFPGTTDKVHISVRDTQVKVDGCGGPVSVRLIATGWMSTSSSDDWVNAYSDIVQLWRPAWHALEIDGWATGLWRLRSLLGWLVWPRQVSPMRNRPTETAETAATNSARRL